MRACVCMFVRVCMCVCVFFLVLHMSVDRAVHAKISASFPHTPRRHSNMRVELVRIFKYVGQRNYWSRCSSRCMHVFLYVSIEDVYVGKT